MSVNITAGLAVLPLRGLRGDSFSFYDTVANANAALATLVLQRHRFSVSDTTLAVSVRSTSSVGLAQETAQVRLLVWHDMCVG